ncbi:polyamine oxidase 1 [Exaiptasia diaphana]|uniref:Amine oxidase n=1 Tax=Exaiptasia diaphana TaxID=2652724 RepID=A0A913XH23_EXADI|nr:polyamine oxidase 1 [Exaiptasia diaphana]
MFRVLIVLFAASIIPQYECAFKRTKVLILGSGVSGITAAKTLLDSGVNDFLILDAQDYIGGRFKQVDFQGFKLEEGANWIHHVDENDPLWKLKMKYKLRGKYTNYEDTIIRNEKGESIPYQEIQDRFDRALNGAMDLEKQRQKDSRIDIPMRIGLNIKGWNPQKPSEKVVEYREVDFEYTEKPEMDSLSQIETRGTDFFVVDPRGYGHIWKETAKPFQDKIKLNTVVTKIMYHDNGVRVETKDGNTYVASFAICTFSTSVLKSNLVQFSPALPSWKIEALHKVPMGVYTKIFIKFPRKFWDSHEFILYAHRHRGYYPVWMDLEMPGIAPGSGLLHVTVTSEVGRRVERQSEKETLSEIMTELRKVYGPNIPQAQGIFYSKWSLNPYTQGSYPNAVPGTTSNEFHNLQGNLKRLYFAGDAVDETWVGFVQGAYVSGARTARAVLKCIKRDCPHFYPKKTVVQSVFVNQKRF